jgi:hypothetical protein
MTKIQLLCLPISLLMLLTNAHADIYTCKDSAGHLVTSDRAVKECSDKTTEVYTNTGVLKDQLLGPLTPEQKQAAQLQEQKRIKEAQEQEKLRKEQLYLIAHYPNEQDVEIARRKALDIIDTKIASEKQVAQEATDALNNKNRNQTSNQNDQAKNVLITDDDLKVTIQQANRHIQRYLVEKVEVNRQFDETHKRYLEIVGTGKKNSVPDQAK